MEIKSLRMSFMTYSRHLTEQSTSNKASAYGLPQFKDSNF